MPTLIEIVTYKKRKSIFKVALGYFFALTLTLAIVFLALSRLNKINDTVDELTNGLAEARSLAQDIMREVQAVHFYEEKYRQYFKQNDLDNFNQKMTDLKSRQAGIKTLVKDKKLLDSAQMIQDVTNKYENEFEDATQLIMLQQSLLSTQFIKQELLIENQLSAIRINVAIVQMPNIFFSFGNARGAFELMRLYQYKYLSKQDEKYFVMFKRNYNYANQAFTDLKEALHKVDSNNNSALNAERAKVELQIYYDTFVKIHSANLALKEIAKSLNSHRINISKIATQMSAQIELKYLKHNESTQQLVKQTKIELSVTIIVAILINLLIILYVLQRIISPIFHDMENLTNLDGLTGIANRRHFDTCLQAEKQRTKREQQALTLMMCDVDYFKNYNDLYGHQMGDACLQKIANTINLACKRPGDLAARYGGEEFAIILPNTGRLTAMKIAQQVLSNIEALHIQHEGSSISQFVTMSMGITTIEDENISIEELILQADNALYCAKANGRNCIVQA